MLFRSLFEKCDVIPAEDACNAEGQMHQGYIGFHVHTVDIDQDHDIAGSVQVAAQCIEQEKQAEYEGIATEAHSQQGSRGGKNSNNQERVCIQLSCEQGKGQERDEGTDLTEAHQQPHLGQRN